ncbi:MAG: preprotein translocase subunit SecG [Candidatus Shapirobacteria bacterium]|nr:preprotein translocase subunit SecG [Candidatus Shapirobacteria bacterium]
MTNILDILQIIISLVLVAIILLTVRGGGFSQGAAGNPPTKTGSEKIIFYSLIVLAILFAALSIVRLYFF